jgi:hypothetical protein
MAQCVPVTWQKSDRGLFLPTLGGRGRYIEIVDGRKRIVVKSLAQGV